MKINIDGNYSYIRWNYGKVPFQYNPAPVAKVKAIIVQKWNLQEKCWSFPNKNRSLKKLLKIFEMT
ncbi:hypothetical protein D9V84_06775 [Bacteroidetes/Chlorobi group bacterium Naka2016]|jgi:hypothetical protein|nr:MAG: hypothetical protein D9V84_06775 [Bacteroidetes/Chlorobi group bacterium Naka2016]